MTKPRKEFKYKSYIKIAVGYGFHIWFILFLANIILLYTFQRYSFGAAPTSKVAAIPDPKSGLDSAKKLFIVPSNFLSAENPTSKCMTAQEVSSDNRCLYVRKDKVYEVPTRDNPIPCGTDVTSLISDSDFEKLSASLHPKEVANFCTSDPGSSTTPVPTPAGPVINLSFTVPGIGSEGGNLSPLHPTRSVTVYLYSLDANSLDKNIQPLNTAKGQVTFDSDSNTSRYTTFTNLDFGLGDSVQDGRYQIVFKTDQSLQKLIKEKPDSVGGKVFSLSKGHISDEVPMQSVILGDIAPQGGNNVMDIADYNMFVGCFGSHSDSSSCPQKDLADFDDNGVVDGIDYNIMILGFKELLAQGFSVPSIPIPTPQKFSKLSKITPLPKVAKVNKGSPTPKLITKDASTKGSPLAGILFFLFLVFGGVIIFLFFKNKKFKESISGFFSKFPVQPHQEAAATTQTSAEEARSAITTPENNQPEDIQASDSRGETPQKQTPEASQSASGTASTQPTPGTSQPSLEGAIDKEYYIKKHSVDEKDGAQWLVLTDDNGPIPGYYKGKEVIEGFAKVKGEIKEDNGKKFILISEIVSEG